MPLVIHMRRALGRWLRRHRRLYPLYKTPFRYVTSPLRKLPDWYIIGAPKCATTTMYAYIVSHPDIDPCKIKETGFYYKQWEYGEHYYRSMFPVRRRGRLTGEATVSYLAHPLPIARRVHELTPDAKIIVMTRNPVDRAYSNYNMVYRSGHETAPTFEEALELEEERHAKYLQTDMKTDPWHMYMGHGEYDLHIKRWSEYFPADRMLIVNFDDFTADPHAVLSRVWDHIGVRQVRVPDLPPQNVGTY